MKLEGVPQILDFNPFDVRTEAEATHNIGEAVYLADGRCFRYARVGGTAVSQGKLQLAPTPKTNHHNLAVLNQAIGDTQFTVTLGATAAVAGEYEEGYLGVNDVDGEGATYKIKSHPVASASASLVVTLFDPIDDDTTANTEVSLVHNTYRRVIEGTSVTQIPAGVPVEGGAAEDFIWLQTKGIASVLAQGTVSLGSPVMAGSVAGSVTDITDVTAPITQIWVGYAPVAGVDTEYRPIMLTIN